MSKISKDKDQEKGDEVLRRLLKTPPEPKPGKEGAKRKPHTSEKDQAAKRR